MRRIVKGLAVAFLIAASVAIGTGAASADSATTYSTSSASSIGWCGTCH